MAMSAELGETLESYVSALVKSGRYQSKSEVLREGVRLLQERETRLAELDFKLRESRAAADRGDLHPAEAVFADLRSKIGSIKAKA